ncbi:TPA: hypothetical protein HA219_02885 [Candidatus Woesearchaeota archaeon]|nr:hypothetical protein [Candidatus Woesearchaeota archaeon]HIH39638.1 hypothetical protein [Candidatus Woesearchaeota archaeon]
MEIFYTCPECGFSYKEKKWRDRCKRWCSAHKSCNLNIIKHGVSPK